MSDPQEMTPVERPAASVVLRYGLAVVSVAVALGSAQAFLYLHLPQPFTAFALSAIAITYWYGGTMPGVFAALLSLLATCASEIIMRMRSLFKKGAPQRESVDVNEIIREMVVLLRGEAARYSIKFRTELAVDLPRGMADRVQLQQVLMNLMLNGIEAMKETAGAREFSIKSQRAESDYLFLSVSDTGVGLPAQHTDQIFEAFFTTKTQGTGMGLSISRSIVESHGGRLWAAENSPRGASFHVSLPTNPEVHE